MYNPENLELPVFDDPRLTDYIWEYSVGSWTHVTAVASDEWEEDEAPETDFDFWTPFHYEADFHLLMWPEPNFRILPSVSFDLNQLDPSDAEFASVRAQLASLCNLDDPEYWLDSWLEEARGEGCDQLWIETYMDVRYEWKVRGWPGLTLEYLKANLKDLEFSKSFSTMSEGAIHLETFEQESFNVYESLTYKDSDLGAKIFLSEYRANPSEKLANQAAQHLYKVGGPELVTFHFPTLDFCRSCGEPSHPAETGDCQLRLSTLNFGF